MVRIKEGETRTYTIPLRKDSLKSPKWRRSERAISTLRKYISKHTKAESVKINHWISEQIWARGNKHPPARVKVNVSVKDKIAIVESSELSPRAKRIEDAKMKAKAEAEKKNKKTIIPDKKKKKEEKEVAEKTSLKKEAKDKESKRKTKNKESKNELKDEPKEAKTNKSKKKSTPTPTKKQEMQMSKK